MAVFKCKMCGGTVEFNKGDTVGVCDSCGTKQTLPNLDDERKANLYDRANHFRRNNDFDKAMGIYEQILSEDCTDAESYWSLVLCRYGIEYVEDPATHKRIPTVNRAQFTSIFADADYKSALNYADERQKEIYEQEATAIDEIQKGILAISQKEEPFDIFICYKETDKDGRRTQDSVLATELYYQLKHEGFKVFFSRITLEDKLGTAYEPYIFAALNSAKVMVAVGTKAEYFNAVWVKNEWSRYLALVKESGGKKVLIPAYRDMDPYDLPEEFSHLQAQDMSKLGFMQDLVRGIKKIVEVNEPKAQETVVINNANANIEPLLKRAFIFLEDGEWQRADEFCEQILNQDPENAYAYLGKLMANLKVKNQDLLGEYENGFENNQYYLKVRRYAPKSLNDKLDEYIENITNINNENAYQKSIQLMKSAKSEQKFINAAESFELLDDFKDSELLAAECREKADALRKNGIYDAAVCYMKHKNIPALKNAVELFNQIPDWKDSAEQMAECNQKIENIEKLTKKTAKISTCSILACTALVVLITAVIIPSIKKLSFISKYGKEFYDTYYPLEKGSFIKFGKYEQNNDTSDGPEDIEWQILNIRDDKILVISRYALDCVPYNTKYTPVTWETCSLRTWLNTTFFETAFSENQKIRIVCSDVHASDNPTFNTDPTNESNDKVFLLSATEAVRYLPSSNEKMCIPTAYAIANSVFVRGNNNCPWWLRSTNSSITYVNENGNVSYFGHSAYDHNTAVRPVMWIELIELS